MTYKEKLICREIDIHKIIDDAMEKKDRTVMIFIGKDGMTIHVDPLNDTKPRWVDKDTTCVCSECGSTNKWPSPFCPICGEKLAAPKIEEGKEE